MIRVDKKKWDSAFEAFMKNPAYKREYDEAPSEACKDYERFTFYYSKYYDPDENGDEMDALEKHYFNRLSADDLRYLIKHNAGSMFVGKCAKRIEELER